MAVFRVLVMDSDGRTRWIERYATHPELVVREVATAGLRALQVREYPGRVRRVVGLRPDALLELSEGLAELLDHGVSLRDSLEVLGGSALRGDVRLAATSLAARLVRGDTLEAATRGAIRGVPSVYLAMISIGERTGRLERIMGSLARLARERVDIRDKLGAALLYPALVLALAVVLLAFVGLYVGPRLAALPDLIGADTVALVDLGASLRRLVAGVLSCGAIGLLIVVSATVTPRGAGRFRAARDALLLRTPGLGRLVLLFEGRALLSALDALVSSGVPLEDALQEAGPVLRNQALAAALARTRSSVLAGAPLSLALAASSALPRDLALWAAIGERTGDVPGVFSRLARFYAYRAERTFAAFAALLEPVLITGVGAVVLWIILVVVVPLFGSLGALVP